MMGEAELIRIVKQTIRQELAPVLMGFIESNQSTTRSTVKRFQTDVPIQNLRNVQPYGFVSRAKKGVECFIVPIDGNPTHLTVAGHFDQSRPNVSENEVAIYGPDGQLIHFKNGGTIHQGTSSADEPVVLGNVMKNCIKDIIEDFTQTEPLGYDAMGIPVFINPDLKNKLIQHLAKYVTTASTNIVGQKNFVERGA